MTPMEQWRVSVETRLQALAAPTHPRAHRMPLGRCRCIAEAVCAARGIGLEALLGPRGIKPISEARMIAVHLAVRHAGSSLSEIGRLFRRHHTTVIHADQTIHARAAAEPALARELADIARAAGIKQGDAA